MPRREYQSSVNTTSALAEHLGLSRWTVSRALNGHAGVKAETVARVRAAMEELGFHPNPLARGLRGGRTNTVGICYQTYGTPVFSQKLIALQTELRSRGYRAIIELIEDEAETEREVIRHFGSMKVEGVLFVGGPAADNIDHVERLVAEGSFHAVSVDPVHGSSLPSVSLDRGKAMEIALGHLEAAGHRKLALMGVHEGILYGGRRVRALKKAAPKLGFDWSRDVFQLIDSRFDKMDYRSGRGLAERFISELAGKCTAILAINDQVAIGAMGLLSERGIAVPRDVSIVGFDNLEVARHLNPSLATVDQRIHAVARKGVDLLLGLIAGRPAAGAPPLLVEPEFIMGDSLGPANRRL